MPTSPKKPTPKKQNSSSRRFITKKRSLKSKRATLVTTDLSAVPSVAPTVDIVDIPSLLVASPNLDSIIQPPQHDDSLPFLPAPVDITTNTPVPKSNKKVSSGLDDQSISSSSDDEFGTMAITQEDVTIIQAPEPVTTGVPAWQGCDPQLIMTRMRKLKESQLGRNKKPFWKSYALYSKLSSTQKDNVYLFFSNLTREIRSKVYCCCILSFYHF